MIMIIITIIIVIIIIIIIIINFHRLKNLFRYVYYKLQKGKKTKNECHFKSENTNQFVIAVRHRDKTDLKVSLH